jgi:hypothetical protein
VCFIQSNETNVIQLNIDNTFYRKESISPDGRIYYVDVKWLATNSKRMDEIDEDILIEKIRTIFDATNHGDTLEVEYYDLTYPNYSYDQTYVKSKKICRKIDELNIKNNYVRFTSKNYWMSTYNRDSVKLNTNSPLLNGQGLIMSNVRTMRVAIISAYSE